MAYYGAELWIEEEAGIGTERGVVKRSNDGERCIEIDAAFGNWSRSGKRAIGCVKTGRNNSPPILFRWFGRTTTSTGSLWSLYSLWNRSTNVSSFFSTTMYRGIIPYCIESIIRTDKDGCNSVTRGMEWGGGQVGYLCHLGAVVVTPC